MQKEEEKRPENNIPDVMTIDLVDGKPT